MILSYVRVLRVTMLGSGDDFRAASIECVSGVSMTLYWN